MVIARSSRLPIMMMVMKPRPKLRTFCRWMLTILTVMLVVVWIGSGWYALAGSVYGFSNHRKVMLSFAVDQGRCIASIDDGSNHFVDEHGLPFPGVCTFGSGMIEVEQVAETPGFEWEFRKTDDLDYHLWFWHAAFAFAGALNDSFILK